MNMNSFTFLTQINFIHCPSQVDLSKLEQFEPWYLAINQKHRVPVLEENGG